MCWFWSKELNEVDLFKMITSSNIRLVLTRQSGLPLDQDFLIFLVLSGLVKKVQIIIMLDK